jgi:hypothetical protein
LVDSTLFDMQRSASSNRNTTTAIPSKSLSGK